MKISVRGKGTVGHALATKLASLDHDVMMDARERGNERAEAWADANDGSAGSFEDAGSFGELVVLATLGSATLEAAKMAGEENLAGKIVPDVTNPLDMSTLTTRSCERLEKIGSAAFQRT